MRAKRAEGMTQDGQETELRRTSFEYWVSGVGFPAACGSALLLTAGAISLIEKETSALLCL